MPKTEKRSTTRRPVGRPAKPRTDTERLDLLIRLLGGGRNRNEVSIGWGGGDSYNGALELHAGPAGYFQKHLAEDRGGDLRRVLDRALIDGVTVDPPPRVRRRSLVRARS